MDGTNGELVQVPASADEANALLAAWRCCGAPGVCGARCMNDEQSHRLAQFVAFIDNERANSSGLVAEVQRLRERPTYDESAIRGAVKAMLMSERIGGRDSNGYETTILVYSDEAAAAADEVVDTLRLAGPS